MSLFRPLKGRTKTLVIIVCAAATCAVLISSPAVGALSLVRNCNSVRQPARGMTISTNFAEPLPDLTVRDIKIVKGKSIRVVIRNLGTKASTPCVLSIKVFNGILSDVLYSTRMNVPAILPHSKKTLFFNTRGRPLEGNSIKAVVDATNVVTESDEDNNENSLTTAP